MHLLAESNLGWINVGISACVAIGVAIIHSKGKERDRQARDRHHDQDAKEADRARKIDSLERKLEESTEATKELATKLVTEKLLDVQRRLDDGSSKFGKMDDYGRDLERSIVKGLAEIKQVIAEKAASKQDLKEHQGAMESKVQQIQAHLGQQDIKHAQLAQRVEDALSNKRGP